MMFKRIFVYGLMAGLAMLVAGMGVSQVFTMMLPGLEAEYQNEYLFRPWSDPAMLLYFVHPFIIGIILAWFWEKTKVVFPASSAFVNGLQFALAYWAFSLGGMLMSYSSFPISLTMIGSWTAGLLVEAIVVGVLLSLLNPRKSPAS
jgi:hypothetical protein